MSTNKTQNYQLHAWEPGDDFLLSEINENFAAIDAVLPRTKRLRAAAGSYLGDAESGRIIEVGFRPKAVVLACKMQSYHPINTICVDGTTGNSGCAIVDGGFTVSSTLNQRPNDTAGNAPGSTINPYFYLALGWEEE